MKAVLWTGYGGPEVLKLGEIEKPEISDNEILVKIVASTVSMGDCEMRGLNLPLAFKVPIRMYFGLFKPRKGILGQEFSGVVEKIGEKITRFKPGDEVFGQTGFSMGSYAQYIKINEKGMTAKKPGNISFNKAAALSLGGLESWYFLKNAGIGKGDNILIIGAGGSIGTIGIQLAKMLGVIVTGVDSDDKFDAMKSAGADFCINYKKDDYLNSGLKYSAVFDIVGKIPLKRGLNMLDDGGVYLHANPKISQMIFRAFLKKGKGKRIIFKSSNEDRKNLDELAGFASDGIIKPVIDRVIKLEEVAWAHEYVESGKKKGSLVISIDVKYIK